MAGSLRYVCTILLKNALVIFACISFLVAPLRAEDCTATVREAIAKQNTIHMYRAETMMIGAGAIVSMTIEYDLPHRMRQIILRSDDKASSETVVVDNKAWTRQQGGPWTEMPKSYTDQLVKQLSNMVKKPPANKNFYTCEGEELFNGERLLKYRSHKTIESMNASPDTKKDKTDKGHGAQQVRMVLIDSTLGLPVQNTIATAARPDTPFYRSTYTYLKDLKIEAPTKDIIGQKDEQ